MTPRLTWAGAISALLNPPAMPPVHRARLLVSADLLHTLLMMPDTMRILNVGLEDGDPRTIVISVEDPLLDPVYEGQLIPEVEPIFSTYDGVLVQAAWPLGEGAALSIVGDVFPDDDDVSDDLGVGTRAEPKRRSTTDPHGKDA